MATHSASSGRLYRTSAGSIPILLVRLGRASDFLVAVAVLVAVLGVAMLIAYLAYG